jgi:hypothetical protein
MALGKRAFFDNRIAETEELGRAATGFTIAFASLFNKVLLFDQAAEILLM